jgi:hypothetical protein
MDESVGFRGAPWPAAARSELDFPRHSISKGDEVIGEIELHFGFAVDHGVDVDCQAAGIGREGARLV